MKPKDRIIYGRLFKGLKYDKNGNPIYTSNDIGTFDEIQKAKQNGWTMSRKHGLCGQINDTSNWKF